MMMLPNLLALALIVGDEPRPTTPPGELPRLEAWNLTLPEAIRIGLDNSEVVRVISPASGTVGGGGSEASVPPGLVIARLNDDASPWNFKAAIMAHVRSVEQTYWALSYQREALEARQAALKLGQEILARQRAEQAIGRGTQADVAEAEQQVDNFKLGLVSASSDLATTEKQLRKILGLPLEDDRRIVPTTRPLEAKVTPGWDDSVAAMLRSSPELVQQRELIGLAEVKAILEGENSTLPPERREASRAQLQRQQAFLRQVLLQSSHSLARSFFNVGSSYDQFQAARNLREAARKRLEAQRAFQEEGRITIDRLLDAVNQHANAISQELQYRATYNTAIAALEEAKGTLLDHDKIAVLEGPAPPRSDIVPKTDAVTPAAFEAPPAKAPPASTTYKIKASLGGSRRLEVEVEVTPEGRP